MIRFAILFAAAVLAGCAELPAVRESAPTEATFELSGRVAVRHGGNGASARIDWRHGDDTDDLLITSPLGQGIARITRRAGEFTLVTADREEYRAADAESLTERVLGWRLPLTGLSDWVRGRSYPASDASVVRDSRSRLAELRQDDWLIEYQEYEDARPLKLRMSRADLEIRLIVDRWVLLR